MLSNRPQLIAYPDRIGRTLADLHHFLETRASGCFGGVHILPLFPSNADGGFSPLTHKEVEPAFGSWQDVETIAADYELCLDITLNHISDESVAFRDFVEKGYQSEYADLFVHVHEFGEITPDDLARIHIRKEKEPFREVQFANGSRGQVWCTFTEQQIDLNYQSEKTFELMAETIEFLTARGVKLFRLDAFGYITKRLGTSCFLVEPDVYRILQWFHDQARQHGAEVLPEVHDHYSYQIAIANHGMRPYGFALPPLVLYSLLEGDSRYLKNWMRLCPRNQVTVLDTHDGICIPDVEGLLPQEKIQAMIDNVSDRSADPILRRSAANVHSVGAIYQLTCTFYEALKRHDDAYLCARAIQLFSPGIPQVYYVGLLAGENDEELLQETGELRDINRHRYDFDEVDAALQRPVVKRLVKLLRLRNRHPAFDGIFELNHSNDNTVDITWRNGEASCSLFVDLRFKTAVVRHRESADGDETELTV